MKDRAMTPLAVDTLFKQQPRLFAYTLPSLDERENAQVGDMVKLFLHLRHYVHPKPFWFVVTAIDQLAEQKTFTAEPWFSYSEEKRNSLGVVSFDTSHIYRLPMDRPEIENLQFDAAYRDQRRYSSSEIPTQD